MKSLNLRKIIIAFTALTTFNAIGQSTWLPNWYPIANWGGNVMAVSFPGIQHASPWSLGGNQIGTPGNWMGNENFSIGTLDGAPFALKSNGTTMMFLDATQRVSIGAGYSPTVPNCVLDIKGTGSNLRIYGDVDGNVASSTNMNLFYNSTSNYKFGVYQGNPSSYVDRFSIDAFGFATVYENMNVGGGIGNTLSRLGIDGLTKTGLTILSGGGNIGFQVCNNAGAPRFVTYDDGRTRIAGNTEIGFITTVGFADPNPRLNIDANGTPGIKITCNNSGQIQKMFYIRNTNSGNPENNFEILGNGATYIGQGRPKIGGLAASAMLSVDGLILAKEIRVSVSSGVNGTHWADYVFDKEYKLMSLEEVEKFVSKNKHLPGVPSEQEVKEQGVDLLSMNVILLKKVEELTLYVMQQQKELEALKKQSASQE